MNKYLSLLCFLAGCAGLFYNSEPYTGLAVRPQIFSYTSTAPQTSPGGMWVNTQYYRVVRVDNPYKIGIWVIYSCDMFQDEYVTLNPRTSKTYIFQSNWRQVNEYPCLILKWGPL